MNEFDLTIDTTVDRFMNGCRLSTSLHVSTSYFDPKYTESNCNAHVRMYYQQVVHKGHFKCGLGLSMIIASLDAGPESPISPYDLKSDMTLPYQRKPATKTPSTSVMPLFLPLHAPTWWKQRYGRHQANNRPQDTPVSRTESHHSTSRLTTPRYQTYNTIDSLEVYWLPT